MIFRIDSADEIREREKVPHRRFVLYKRLVGDHGDLIVICQIIFRRYEYGRYIWNAGDGVWRDDYVAYY